MCSCAIIIFIVIFIFNPAPTGLIHTAGYIVLGCHDATGMRGNIIYLDYNFEDIIVHERSHSTLEYNLDYRSMPSAALRYPIIA